MDAWMDAWLPHGATVSTPERLCASDPPTLPATPMTMPAQMVESLFANNECDKGGAVEVAWLNSTDIYDSAFDNNTARISGGGWGWAHAGCRAGWGREGRRGRWVGLACCYG